MTKEEFIEKANEKFKNKFNYSLVGDFINLKQKVKIICPEHGEFEQRITSHLGDSIFGCADCAEELKTQSTSNIKKFIEKSNIIHNNKYTYNKSVYIDVHTKLIVTCPLHKDFEIKPHIHLAGSGCKQCATESFKQKRSYTHDDFIKKVKEKHGDKYRYDKVVYSNRDATLEIFCIKCDKYFSQNAGEHMRGRGCNVCGNKQSGEKQRSTFEEFLEKAIAIHGDKYEYFKEEYVDTLTKINIWCKKCEDLFLQEPSGHCNGHKCPVCALNEQKTTKESLIEISTKKYPNKFDYSLLPDGILQKNIKYKFICLNKGHITEQRPHQHISTGGCYKCAYENVGEHTKITQEEWIEKAKLKHNNYYTYENTVYSGANKNIIITCPTHKDIKVAAHAHLAGHGCKYCNVSKTEKEWINTLNNPNIQLNEKVYIDGILIKPDGIDYTTNTIYEYNGTYWHGDPRVHKTYEINKHNKKTFGELYDKTIKRQELIKKAGYNLVVMWEFDWLKTNKRQKLKKRNNS
jgi:hypothetical protein